MCFPKYWTIPSYIKYRAISYSKIDWPIIVHNHFIVHLYEKNQSAVCVSELLEHGVRQRARSPRTSSISCFVHCLALELQCQTFLISFLSGCKLHQPYSHISPTTLSSRYKKFFHIHLLKNIYILYHINKGLMKEKDKITLIIVSITKLLSSYMWVIHIQSIWYFMTNFHPLVKSMNICVVTSRPLLV